MRDQACAYFLNDVRGEILEYAMCWLVGLLGGWSYSGSGIEPKEVRGC